MSNTQTYFFSGSGAMNATISGAVSDQSSGGSKDVVRITSTVDGTATAHGFAEGSNIYLVGFTGDLEYLNGLKEIYSVTSGTTDALTEIDIYVPYNTAVTGTANGSETVRVALSSKTPYAIESFNLHVGVAPTTAENFTITLDSDKDAAYDVVYGTYAMAAQTDIPGVADPEVKCKANDVLYFNWDNTDAKIWGLEVEWYNRTF